MQKRLRAALTSLLLIVAVAFCLRLAFALDYQQHNPRHALSTIPFLFEPGNIAYSLVSGRGFGSPFRVDTGPTAWLAPAYPLLLAAIFKLFGAYTFHAFQAAVLLNIVFSTAACLPIYLVGKRLGGLTVAAYATWLWAIFPNSILNCFESLWDASLSAFLAAATLWLTDVIAESNRLRAWCAYGIWWGLVLMTNPTLASTLPFLLAYMAWRLHRHGQAWLKHSLLAVCIAVLCCVPWTVRNYRIFHCFVPIRSTLGLTLWMGNNEQALTHWSGELHPISNSDERAKYIELGEIAYMRAKTRVAIAFMVSHPAAEVTLIGRRFLAFWSGGSSHPVRDFLRIHSFWFRSILLFNVAAAIAALWGMLTLLRKRSIYLFPAAVFPIVYPFAYYLTLVTPRYRLPIDPIVLLLAASGLADW